MLTDHIARARTTCANHRINWVTNSPESNVHVINGSTNTIANIAREIASLRKPVKPLETKQRSNTRIFRKTIDRSQPREQNNLKTNKTFKIRLNYMYRNIACSR